MTKDMISEITFMTSGEVAEKLQLNQQVVVRKLQTGEIPGYKIGKDWRVSSQQLLAWLESKSKPDQAHRAQQDGTGVFKDGRLTDIPAQRKKRTFVLERLLEEFEPGRVYSEKESQHRPAPIPFRRLHVAPGVHHGRNDGARDGKYTRALSYCNRFDKKSA